MIEKEPTPYPERTEDVIVLVCEPVAEYEKPVVYQGTTISNALKDYYSFITNREKVDVLKWIVAQPAFTELKRLSLAENIKATFIQNPSLRELLIFKGSILIQIDRYLITSKDYSKIIFKEFNRKK